MVYTAGLLFTLILAMLSFSSCQNSEDSSTNQTKIAGNLRILSQSEKAQDFDQLLALFKTYYGAYDYKERTLNINIENEATRLKNLAINAKTDEEFAGYVMQMGALLKDGHVQIKIENTSSGTAFFRIPILLTQIEDKAIVANIDPGLAAETNLMVGDEIIEVDGKTPAEYMATITKYSGWATKASEKHAIFNLFRRPSYMTELIPTKPTCKIRFKKADSTIYVQEIAWTLSKYNADLDKVMNTAIEDIGLISNLKLNLKFNRAEEMNTVTSDTNSDAGKMGAVSPFFITEKSQGKYNFARVYPSDENRKKAGLAENEKPPIFAALYKHQDKNILLVRIATYSPTDFKIASYLKAYVALLTEFQNSADILVLDQTHNPGGSIGYCTGLYDLVAKKMDVSVVQQCNADRSWINTLKINQPSKMATATPWNARLMQSMGLSVEKAYDNGVRLSDPIPLFTGSTNSRADGIWQKPTLVLIDELAGSCADIFPMLIKANKRAKLFGKQTMGLGGNVEEVGVLNNSNIGIKMTRGLFSAYKENGNYTDADLIENNGVNPDTEYSHTVSDFRGGYVDYVEAFSNEAIKDIK